MDQTTEDLQAAYDSLEQHGWCQCAFQRRDGSVCLDGAIRMAISGVQWLPESGDLPWQVGVGGDWRLNKRYASATGRITRTILAEYGAVTSGVCGNIFAWNDDRSRTVEDVKLILKKAIALGDE